MAVRYETLYSRKEKPVSEKPDELEREETMSDLDVPEAEAEDVKGGLIDKTSRAFKYDDVAQEKHFKY